MPPVSTRRPYARGLGKPIRRKRIYKKRRKPVGNKRISNLKKSKMGRVGLSAALALKTLKQHEPSVTNTNIWKTDGQHVDSRPDNLHSGPDRAVVVHPYALTRSATRSETARECDNIYFFNCRGEFEIQPSPAYIHPYQIRCVSGWAKGIPDTVGTTKTSSTNPYIASNSTSLSYWLQTTECKLNPDHYVTRYDKLYTHAPKNVYTYSENETTGSVTSNAVWTPFKHKFNFKFNKKVMFDGDNPTDIIGWVPFVAVILYHLPGLEAYSFTGINTTARPSPKVKLDTHSYFKDC